MTRRKIGYQHKTIGNPVYKWNGIFCSAKITREENERIRALCADKGISKNEWLKALIMKALQDV